MTVTLHLGDCLDVMRGMPDACVDAVVTDPPYGLEFMGKQWDHGVPGVEFWVEALRVAKPGAHILAFGGTRTFHRLACAIEDAGWQIKDCLSWLYGSGFPKHKTLLKPAWEPVVMAAKAGPRIVNVDACRLSLGKGIGRDGERTAEHRYGARGLGFQPKPGVRGGSSRGRWPANVCLDEEAAAVLDGQSGKRGGGFGVRGVGGTIYADGAGLTSTCATTGQAVGYGDSGGASRFFYVAKASRSEREAGLREAPRSTMGDGIGGQPLQSIASRNHHPTVKPVALMRWLVRLVTPPDGVALDPFMGSGTTGIACVREGRPFVGIEREPEYHAIAEARIAHARGEAPSNAAQPALPFEVSA